MKILTILLTERQTNGKIKQQSLISAFSPELKRRCVEPNNYFFFLFFLIFKHNNIKNSKYIYKHSCRSMRFQYFRIVKFVCTLENELKGLFVYFLQRFARSPSLTPKCSCGKLNLTYLGKLISNKTFHYSGFYDLLNQS